ncbi:hypothetical protein M9194_07480 [Vibrio sp. S4M6]|uniref:plasmid fertility inhibition factor family protein n=1 Tax=Vibrio sinus TaxID=2946865 RepID=UPI002029E014|nr:hypothetical protein [Vibrio sinus]MCL9781268.1 hypothetical protein [Vibrio sinus]
MDVYKVRVNNRRFVYLSDSSRDYRYSKVVMLDPKFFIYYWHKQPFPIIPKSRIGEKKHWRNYYKYSLSDKLFSFSKSKPVPMAQVSAGVRTSFKARIQDNCFLCKEKESQSTKRKELEYVFVEDGTARLIWLLNNEADYIPVLCTEEEEPLFEKLAIDTNSLCLDEDCPLLYDLTKKVLFNIYRFR